MLGRRVWLAVGRVPGASAGVACATVQALHVSAGGARFFTQSSPKKPTSEHAASTTGRPTINDLKVPELKKMLQDRGLSTAGLKADLAERLKAVIESSGGDSSNGGHSAAETNPISPPVGSNLPSSLDSTAAAINADVVNIPAAGATMHTLHVSAAGARSFTQSKKRTSEQAASRPAKVELSEYENTLRTSLKSVVQNNITSSDTQDYNADASNLPRVLLERFLRNQRQPSANFIYAEKGAKKGAPPEIVCTVRAAGRSSEGKGESRFDATQQACHQWLHDFKQLHTRDRKLIDKMRPKAPEPPMVFAPADAPWHELSSHVKKQTAIKAPWLAPVPELEHGLSRVLHKDNSRATPIWEKLGGMSHSDYLRTIVQPKDINWEAIAPFTPPSRDSTLHELTLKHKAKYKASTSSITGLLGHVYLITSNYRPTDTSGLGSAFRDQPDCFSYTVMKKPVSVMLRPKDGVYGIDSQKDEKSDNQILIDLGKTMERMLTMPESDFKSLMMNPLTTAGAAEEAEEAEDASVESMGVMGGMRVSDGGAKKGMPAEFLLGAYNFSMSNRFMLRSQLDCIYGGNQIFDIKTRATHAIRNCFNLLPDVPAAERHLHFLDYKITQQSGLWNSFERELYDMIRAAFIKYAPQCRIGRMDGAFVTYHNTQEIFGFQYVSLKTMDKLVYGSCHMAALHFDQGLKLLGALFDHVIDNLEQQKQQQQEHEALAEASAPMHVTITPQKSGRCLHVEVCRVLSESTRPADRPGDDPQREIELGPSEIWYLFVDTYVNGKLEKHPWNIGAKDTFQVKYRIVEAKDCLTEDQIKQPPPPDGVRPANKSE